MNHRQPPAIETHPQSGTRRLPGYLFIAAAAVCWGTSATLGRAVFTGHLLPPETPIDPLILAQSRVTFAALLLVPVLLALRGARALRLPFPEVLRALLLGAGGIAISNYGYYLAIQKTNVATAIVLQYTAPVWVLFYLVARKRQKATWTRMAGVVAAFTGIALAIGALAGKMQLNLTGVMAAFAAAFSFAFYNVYGYTLLRGESRRDSGSAGVAAAHGKPEACPTKGRRQGIDGVVLTVYALLGAAVFWLLVNPPWKVIAAHYGPADWLFLFGFSLLSMLAPTLLYFHGLKSVDATRAIVTSCLEPVTGITLATLFLAEPMDWTRGLGVALVLLAIVLIQRRERGEEG